MTAPHDHGAELQVVRKRAAANAVCHRPTRQDSLGAGRHRIGLSAHAGAGVEKHDHRAPGHV